MMTIFLIALIVATVVGIAFWDAGREERKNRDDERPWL